MIWFLLACFDPLSDLLSPGFPKDGDEGDPTEEDEPDVPIDKDADFTLDDADVEIYGNGQSRFGWNVTDLGDLDSDGISDFGLSCHDGGNAWIVHGPVGAGSGPVEDFATGTITDAGHLGYAMSRAGDVDWDGNGDVLVGNPYWTAPGDVYGTRAYVFEGPATGDLAPDDAYITWTGAVGSWAGASVDGGFDFNGDRRVDYVIGAPSAGETADGAAYLVYGPTTAGRYDLDADADVRFEDGLEGLGSSVAGVDDMDGDGLDDLVLGDWEDEGWEGAFFLFRGGGLAGTYGVDEADVVFEATRRGHSQGHAIADAGDTNGDGYGDLWLTEPELFGAAYLVLGPVTVGGVISEVADAAVVGMDDHDEVGVDVAGEADLNLDGYADALVGSTNAVPQTSAPGAVYSVLGPMGGTIPVSDAHKKIVGTTWEEAAGNSVAFIGDQNGDAVPEALIGALDYEGEMGRVTMILGSRL